MEQALLIIHIPSGQIVHQLSGPDINFDTLSLPGYMKRRPLFSAHKTRFKRSSYKLLEFVIATTVFITIKRFVLNKLKQSKQKWKDRKSEKFQLQTIPLRYVLDKDYLYSVLFSKSNFRVNTRAGCK